MKKLNKEKTFYIFQGEAQLKAFMGLKDKYTLYKMPDKYPVVLVGETTNKGEHFLRKITESDIPLATKVIQNLDTMCDKEKLHYAQVMEVAGYKEGVRYAEIRESVDVKTTFKYHHVTKINLNGSKKFLFANQTGTVIYTLDADNYHLCSSHDFYSAYINNKIYDKFANNTKNTNSKTKSKGE